MTTNPDTNEIRVRDTETRKLNTLGTPHSVPLRSHSDISDEEGPWAHKTILSFDGGGIRGLSSLRILKEIMLMIRQVERAHPEFPVCSSSSYPWMGTEERQPSMSDQLSDRVDDFLPCHYFDYVAGTSTGGLSSIMLGRLRMTVDEALDQYKDFGNTVFGKPRWFHERSFLWYPRAKFSCRKTRTAFQKVVYTSLSRDQRNALPTDAYYEPLKHREDRTRTMVISFGIQKGGGVSKEYIWRSYDNNFVPPRNPTTRGRISNPCNAHTTTIWEVARATTAAPRYFESIKIGNRTHLDGGMAANNPSLLALQEIYRLHRTVPAFHVSIGTGLKGSRYDNNDAPRPENGDDTVRELRRAETSDDVRRKQFLKKYMEIGRHSKDKMLDCEGAFGTEGWLNFAEVIHLDRVWRFNVEGDLCKIPLDDWRPANTGDITLNEVIQRTEAYLKTPSVRRDIESIANQAVAIRHRRAETERWEAFAVDVDYYCPTCGSPERHQNRAGLRAHLQESSAHRDSDREPNLSGEEVEAALNSGRVYRGAPRHARPTGGP